MKNKLFALLLTILSVTPAFAMVDSASFPTAAVEESILTFKGTKFDSASNPLSVQLITADGANVALSASTINKKKGQIILPTVPQSVAGLIQVTLRISGGDVSSSDPQNFVVLLAQRPASAPSSLPAGTVSVTLPETTTDGIGVEGPAGPTGADGKTGPAGSSGPQGPAGTFPPSVPGNIVTGFVNNANNATVVTLATQNAITTLPALISAGTLGATTNVLGSVDIDQNLNVDGTVTATGFNGPLTGDVTGQVTVGTQTGITDLPNLATVGSATTFTGAVTTPTVSATDVNTTNVTATNVNATNLSGFLTGSISGNAAGSSATFTGSLAGDVTGGMGSTAIASSVVLGKTLSGYSADNGTVADGDSIFQAIQNLDGNNADSNAKIEINRIAIGAPTATATNNEIVKRDASGNFAANVITATTFVGSLSGSINGLVNNAVQPNIVNMAGLTSIGATTVPTTVRGPLIAAEGISGTFTGNVNGNLNGQVLKPTQTFITTLPALTGAGTAGATTAFAGSTAVAENLTVAGTANITGAATASVFNGPLNGNATSATTAISFTGPLVGEVTGTQGATVVSSAAVLGKTLSGYSADNGTVADGDSITTAIAKLDGNSADNLAKINANKAFLDTVNGKVATNIVDIAANTAAIATKADAAATTAALALKADASALAGKVDTATFNALDNQVGDLAVLGGNSVNLTSTAATNLTLPTSGTLATFDVDASVAGVAIDVTTASETISVAGKNFIKVTDSGCTTGSIAEFSDGVVGQRLTVMSFGCGPQVLDHIPDGTPDTIVLQGAANLTTLGAGDTFEVIFDGTQWLELSRSNN